MWTRAELKTQGKAAFKLNYWKSVGAAFLLTLLSGITTFGARSSTSSTSTGTEGTDLEALAQQFNNLTEEQKKDLVIVLVAIMGVIAIIGIISVLLKSFVFNPLQLGCFAFFNNNVKNPPAPLDTVGMGFRNYGHTFATFLLRDLYLVLWSLLFVIPGIVKAYSYRMVPYIMAENPELSANETITRSREMMNGHKWNAFLLDLSFIGWYLLGVLTLNLLNVFWTNPYKENTDAALYQALSRGDTRQY